MARASAPPPQRPREVFGEVLEVIAAEGADATRLPRRRRVLLVWWDVGAACERALPARALGAVPGELFLQRSLRDSAGSTDATPTYDIGPGALAYGPSGQVLSSFGARSRAMTVPDLVDLYRVLPAADARARDPDYVCSARRAVPQGQTRNAMPRADVGDAASRQSVPMDALLMSASPRPHV